MPNHKHAATHSMLTLPSISPVRHAEVRTQRHTFFVLRSKIQHLQLCPSFLHDLKLPVLSAPDIHTSTHSNSIAFSAHTCMLTNLMEAITELSPSCWLAIKCFPPTILCKCLYPFPVELACMLLSQLSLYRNTYTNLTISFF